MSVNSKCVITIAFSGDVAGTQEYSAANNDTSPGAVQLITLVGDSPYGIVYPVDGGATPTRVTIVKPPDNTFQIYLKGEDSDVGVPLHLTDPDSISISPAVPNLILMCDGAPVEQRVPLRLVWS